MGTNYFHFSTIHSYWRLKTIFQICRIAIHWEKESFYEYLSIEDTVLFNLPCDNWRDKPSSAKNWSNLKLFFTKELANIKHHTTLSVVINDEAVNAILQLIGSFVLQQQYIANMCTVQEQPVNSASEYKDLGSKAGELMAKINSIKLQYQEES